MAYTLHMANRAINGLKMPRIMSNMAYTKRVSVSKSGEGGASCRFDSDRRQLSAHHIKA
jgi:hypothetical protein